MASRRRESGGAVRSSSVPRAVIFDVGGVLLRRGGRAARRAWEERLGLAEGDLDRVQAECIGSGWEGGRTEHEINERLMSATGIRSADLPCLLDAPDADHHLEPALVQFIRGIRPRCHVGVLANAGPASRERWSRQFALDQLVDAIVVSAEEGISKPDVRIYRLAAGRLGVPPGECVFVDDKEGNVAGARAAGMTAVHHVAAAETVSALRALFGGRR